MQPFISLPSYKRCDSLSNYGYSFTKDFYPIYYNLFPYLLRENPPNAKKREFRAIKLPAVITDVEGMMMSATFFCGGLRAR